MADKKQLLYDCAQAVFSQKGFKNTNVTDITSMAGVAAGTFYNYFTSKDRLFMEIYNEENVKLKRSILEQVDTARDPAEVLARIMALNEEGIRCSPILREWYNRESFDRIEKAFREETGMGHIRFMYDSFLDIVRQWQHEGRMRADISAEMVMAMFTALITIDLHKDEIGLDYFPEALAFISKCLMDGLMPPRDAR